MNKHISQIAGLFVIAIACLVLIGWQFDIHLLKAGFRGMTATMKVNTAICFLLAGMSLTMLPCNQPTRTQYQISKLFAGAIVVVGLMTLSEYFLDWNLRIDELFFRDTVSSATPYPGRMGVNTALNFVLMGIALLLLGRNSQRGTWLAHICSTVAAVVSLLSFVGYVFEVDIATRLIVLKTSQAVHTSLGFLILYVGILAVRPHKGLMQAVTSSLVGGAMARRLLPWSLIFPIVLNWFTSQGVKLGWYDTKFEYVLQVTFAILTFSTLIWGASRYLNEVDLRRKKAELALNAINETLESLVAERTKALRISEKQFRYAFEDASIGIAIIGLNGQFIKVNSVSCQIVGYPSEELVTLTFQEITHPDDLETDLNYVDQLLAGKASTYQMEKRYFHKNGHIVWVLLNVSLVRDDLGNPLHFIAQIQDIMARKEAQKELELQSLIIHNMSGGVSLMQASDLTIVYTNPKFDRMFGYGERELVGQCVRVTNYFDTDVTPDVSGIDVIKQIDRDGEAQYEVCNKKKDGTLFWTSNHASRFDHPEYGVVYVVVKQDVTELKLAQQALKATTDRLNFLLNYSPVVIFSNEPDGDYSATFISENIKDLLGYEAREFLENSTFWLDHLHPDDLEPVMNKFFANSFVNDFYSYEYRFLRSDGVYRWLLAQLRLIRDSAGRPTEVLGYWIDITDRKQAEAELEKLSNRLALSLKSGAIGCWELDLDQNRVLWDERMYELYGMTKTNNYLLPCDVRASCFYPDDRLPTETLINQAILGQAEYDTEFRIVHPDGSIHFIKAYGVLVRDSRGEAYSMIGINFDITDRKQSELALQQAKEAAESANRAKSIFLSNMSHELRTPLNSILGFTQLMLNEDSISPSSQERLRIVTRSGEYLLDLINDILDLSKIESGRMTLNNSEFDLKRLLNSIEEMLRVKVQAKEVRLIFEQDLNLPRFIHTDQKKLYQVLVNLLGNAIKFTNQGSVILRVNVASTDETSCNLYFEIEDTGVGVAPEEIDNLFKVFVQAQAGNNLNQGTGLGLAISQKIIHLMGSQIHVKSTLNQGSIFSFNIKVPLPQVALFTSQPLNQRVIGLATNQPIYRILVVEDSAENRLLLVGILTTVGFEVREATDGMEAIALWESWSPHLILMDLRMPFMDGYTAIKRIRENPKNQETMVIALTASVFEDDREKVLNVGCNDFIRKPFQQKELFDKIAQHLGVQYRYQTIEASAHKSSVELLSVEALSEMSPQWLEDMYQAAYYLDADVMNELIAQIPKSNARLSKALTDSINNFNCDRILELIRSLESI